MKFYPEYFVILTLNKMKGKDLLFADCCVMKRESRSFTALRMTAFIIGTPN
jgi:hypothetical protein